MATTSLSARDDPATARRLATLGALAVLLAAALLASLAVGARPLPPAAVWRALWEPDGGREAVIVWQLRMPRAGLGLLTGVGFALAGALMQAATRNPLADPGLLGVNAGAALAVALVLATTGGAGLGGSVLAALLGAAISACLGAITGVITMTNPAAFDSYRFWIVGSLAGRPPEVLALTAPLVAAGAVTALALGPSLNALALGEDAARGLGLPVGRLRAILAVAITLLVGASVAAAGPIGFSGLVTPHAARLAMGEDWRWILPACLLAGPGLMLWADVAGRVIARPGEIEAGVTLAFIGAPVLLGLVLGGAAGRVRR